MREISLQATIWLTSPVGTVRRLQLL